MKRILKLLTLGFLLLGSVLIFNTLRFNSIQSEIEAIPILPIHSDSLQRFSTALTYKTISHENDRDFEADEFIAFNQFLRNAYPKVYTQLTYTPFNEYSHLFYWQGSDKQLKPIILMGHYDVVPIASPEQWTQAPFSGLIKDDIIWGRGTIDDKISVIATLEAVAYLLENNFQPKRSIYLAFGHDEEIGGEKGAKAIADYMVDNKIEAEFVLDEGYGIIQGLIPDIETDTAFIGIAEKRYAFFAYNFWIHSCLGSPDAFHKKNSFRKFVAF